MIIEFPLPLKDLASILMISHRKHAWFLMLDQNLFIPRLKRTWS